MRCKDESMPLSLAIVRTLQNLPGELLTCGAAAVAWHTAWEESPPVSHAAAGQFPALTPICCRVCLQHLS